MGIRNKTFNELNSINTVVKRKKALDMMNSLLKIFTALLVIVFVLYPFLSVFGKALYSDGRINFSEFLFLKGSFI